MCQRCRQAQVSLFEIGINLKSELEIVLCVLKFSSPSMNLADLVSCAGIQRINFEFLLKFLNGRASVFIGATANAVTNQRAGSYTATIILNVTVLP